jgi:Carboxypeptidase regulatory-like domain/TonB dependent receptor
MNERLRAAFLLILSAAASVAQVATGNLRGTVVDTTGAVLPNCSVLIVNTQTGFQRNVTSNEHGDFNAPSLPVGTYDVTVELPGFQKTRLAGIELRVDQTATVPIELKPGAVSESVEVTAAAPLLDTQISSLGQVIENKQILDMPLNGRNPFALGILAGGTVQFQGLTTNLPIVASGGRHNANDILLDGVDDNLRNYAGSVGRAGLAYTPSVDAVEEFKVKTNNFSAEYGHSAGYVMNATIKSGTNEYHGHAWEFLRNEKLDANNFVSNFAGQPRAKYRQNQFGASIGGPVRLPYYNGRDRTFFFMDYEGTQIRQAAGSSLNDEPPLSFRAGNFSTSSPTIYDPASRALGPNGIVTSTPFAGNTIPTSRFDPAALKYQSLIPAPNTGTPNAVSRNYLGTSPSSLGRNQGDVRVDEKLSDKNSLMGRVSVSKQTQDNAGVYIFSPTQPLFNTVNVVLGDTHLFSPTVVNEFRAGYNRANSSSQALKADEELAFAAANGFQSGPIIGFPNVNWTSSGQTQSTNQFTAFTGATSNYAFENNFQYTDNLTVIRGSHTFKMGADFRRFRFDRLQSFPPAGNYYFGPTYTSNPSVSQATGNPYADFLLGLPTSVINSSPIDWSRQRDLYFGPYIQDDWKVTRNLTLNLGFRYDLYTQPVDAKDTGGMFDPNGVNSAGRRGIIIVPGTNGYTRAIVKGHHKNFAPRFGFAYQATPKMVVRGGWGMFYSNREQNDQTTDMALSLLNFQNIDMPAVSAQTTVVPPFTFTSPLRVNPIIDPQFSAFTASRPLSSDSGSFNAADINFSKFPMLQQFNLAVQYEVIRNLLVEVSYAGSRGVHWVQRVDLNQVPFSYALQGINRQANRPFPFLASSVGLDTANVSNWYNSANLRIEKRYSYGLVLLANYTISHATDSGNSGISTFSNQGNTRAMNSYDLSRERGVSPLDLPQKFIMSADYELPIGNGKPLSSSNGFVNAVFGGWQVNGILTLRSGLPTDVLVGRLPPVFATVNRPDVVPGQSTTVENPGFDQYFNPAAFAIPGTVTNALGTPVQTFGNAGRSILRGPGSKNLDASLFKAIPLGEARRLEFRAEAFNLTNTPTFTLPSARSAVLTVGNPAFGKLSGSQTVGRQIQFGLKLIW